MDEQINKGVLFSLKRRKSGSGKMAEERRFLSKLLHGRNQEIKKQLLSDVGERDFTGL